MSRYPFSLKRDHEDTRWCGVSRCRQPAAMILLDLGLCDDHWVAYCDHTSQVDDPVMSQIQDLTT